jgi:hypothetical protein
MGIGVIRRTFKWATDEDTGMDGWLMAGAPSSYQPLGAVGTVHDLLEHPENDKGTAVEEAQAFGAACYIRGEGGYWSSRRYGVNNPGENFAADLSNFINENGFKMTDPPRTMPVDALVEIWIDSAITHTKKELTYDNEWEWTSDDETNIQRLRGWMRIGYRRARKRYGCQGPYEMAHIFMRLENQVEKVSKHAEIGDQLELGLCVKTGEILCRKTDVYELEPYNDAE